MLSDQDLADIVGRASSLDERLADDPFDMPRRRTKDQGVADRRLNVWLRALGASEKRLARRLELLPEHEAVTFALVGAIAWKGDAFPGWARAVAWVARAIEKGENRQAEYSSDPVPFEELLWPAVRAADRRLGRRLGPRMRRCLGPTARADLRSILLCKLSALCARPLFAEFDLFRRSARLTIVRRVVEPQGSRPLYDAFVADCRDGIDALLRAKPVLARLIGSVVEQWVDATTEFAERLDRDLEAMAAAFAGGQELGRVTGIETNVSDPHRGGRTVAIVRFASGICLVYKPKDVRIDTAWASLVTWLAERHAPIELRAMRALSRQGYGWSEFAAAEMLDPAQASRFHRCAGALLAMFHLFGARDMHAGNIVISGGLPIVIDLETLLHADLTPGLREAVDDAAALAASDQVARSVLATLFLPLWARALDGRAVALGGIDGDRSPMPRKPKFVNINTDEMASANDASARSSADGRSSLLATHAEDVIAGFSTLYSFLLAKREALLAPTGPLAWFRDAVVRVVIRPTADYLAIEELAQGSRNALDDGVDWSLRFEALGSAIPTSRGVEAAWRIFAAERHAMTRLDVPFFSAASNATEVVSCGGETIPNCLVDTPFVRATTRVTALSSDDLQRQVQLISAALPASLDRSVLRVSCTKPGKDLAADAVTAARRIARIIARSAVRAGDGASWVGPVPLDHDHASLDVVETDLYAGTIGIALFLAALSRSITDAQSRALALAAIASAERHFSAPRGSARSVPRMNIGGGTGIGSAIYGLVRIAGLLEEPRLFDLAAFLSSAITPERVAADRRFCIMRGAAGAILGFLALHAATNDATVLERAAACGRHLVANADRSALPDGLLEGKAGLALALTRLHAATGDPAFRSAAWRFWRPDVTMSCGWCSGASGIGFAAMACKESGDDVMPIIESALATALASPPLASDCICCGNFGRVDFLLTAGQRLGRYHLIERARAETEALLGAAREAGGFRLERRCDELQPGLFRGLSGIGYTLLRVADRGKLPAISIWE